MAEFGAHGLIMLKIVSAEHLGDGPNTMLAGVKLLKHLMVETGNSITICPLEDMKGASNSEVGTVGGDRMRPQNWSFFRCMALMRRSGGGGSPAGVRVKD